MADALDAVPWSTLEVLEGSPDDLPILLRKMRGGWTPTSRFDGPTTDPGDLLYMAIAELGSTQGTCLTSAAPDVASFLVDDVDHLEGDNAVSVLSMLSVIAHGIGWRSGKVDDELTKRCATAVERGYASYVRRLSDPSPGVREFAARLVGAYPARAREACHEVERRLFVETERHIAEILLNATWVRDGGLSSETLGELARSEAVVSPAAALLLARRDSDPEVVASVVARIGQAWPYAKTSEIVWHLANAPEDAVFPPLLRTFQNATHEAAWDVAKSLLWVVARSRLGSHPPRPPRPMVFVDARIGEEGRTIPVFDASPCPEDTTEPSATTYEVMKLVQSWSGRDESDFADALAWAVNIALPVPPADLRPAERAALEAIAENPWYWSAKIDGTDTSDLLEVFGFPREREAVLALLE
ncbi:MAG: hypothetical protein IPG50_20330 [Myxococcales bacterium]|nr:hypothetical protein [Myxococcales bacterium]